MVFQACRARDASAEKILGDLVKLQPFSDVEYPDIGRTGFERLPFDSINQDCDERALALCGQLTGARFRKESLGEEIEVYDPGQSQRITAQPISEKTADLLTTTPETVLVRGSMPTYQQVFEEIQAAEPAGGRLSEISFDSDFMLWLFWQYSTGQSISDLSPISLTSAELSLEDKLEADYDYSVTKRNRLSVNRDEAIEEILDLIDSRFTVGKDLAEEHGVSFLQITTFYLNSLHHFLWDDEATLRGWQIVDEHVGDFLEGDCNLVLMSDHGSTEIETVFNVNSWLEQEGYLTLDTGISEYLYKAGITTDRLIKLAYLFRIPGLAERLVPDRLLNLIPNENRELQREAKTDAFQMKESG
ncbi:alkaline phosphatase family protein [Halostagnicola sp. A56]|uniref:alkaline phosphatase family protein n=1 Tax=Halostagnicola sp. A56 TaxID=1495067 RepID=UPI0018CE1A0D|nr:alkaline phosphatase family protein [Halostagnicola sp. A56]